MFYVQDELLLQATAQLIFLVFSFLFPVVPPQLLPLRDRRYKTTNCVRVNLRNKYKKNNKKQPFFNQLLHFHANLTSLIADY